LGSYILIIASMGVKFGTEEGTFAVGNDKDSYRCLLLVFLHAAHYVYDQLFEETFLRKKLVRQLFQISKVRQMVCEINSLCFNLRYSIVSYK